VIASDKCMFNRINRRNKGISHASAQALRADFESPEGVVVENEIGQSEIISQLNTYYSG
jgi:hypothetical protein